MRRLPAPTLALALAFMIPPDRAQAQSFLDAYWQLLAIDGTPTDARTTLRIDRDNVLAGAAPCNRWTAHNAVKLPALQLGTIRSTRMACDRIAQEQAFFDALGLMTTVALDGPRNLVLTGPGGRSMEFVPDGSDTLSETCKSCPPGD